MPMCLRLTSNPTMCAICGGHIAGIARPQKPADAALFNRKMVLSIDSIEGSAAGQRSR